MVPVTTGIPQRGKSRRRGAVTARGEPMVWLTGSCIASAVLMIVGLLAFIMYNGFTTFWPLPLAKVTTNTGKVILGEPTRDDAYTYLVTLPVNEQPKLGAGQSAVVVATDEAKGEKSVRITTERKLYKTGNYDLTGEDFNWVDTKDVVSVEYPKWGLVIERMAWLNAYGEIESITVDGQTTTGAQAAWTKFQDVHPGIRALIEEATDIERHDMGDISHELNKIRLELRSISMRDGNDSEQLKTATARLQPRVDELTKNIDILRKQATALRDKAATATMVVRTSEGKVIPADRSKLDGPMEVGQVVRTYPANDLGFFDKWGVYFSRWGEYLFDEPREANMEGGVWPAIVGTVLLTFIMIICVVPIGVIAAIYLREYAKQGVFVSIVRISVNNLAGVPSIVYGVFGLGFFCYLVGGSIDQIFFSERLPDPTIGKSALLWASLTLALLTLPVVIVATEEALASVPTSMREGAYGCGASKWQVIWRIVLPRAMPGVMTGTILAIARGAGEVAPLMLVGAVKLAPELPANLEPPFFGSNLSFMHLGFHIYDLGFQSRNSEAARNMVYTTTLLLILIVVVLNITAMVLRSRLRRAYSASQF